MNDIPTWHATTIRDLQDILIADPDVELLALVGSGARSHLDAWSDLDVLIVVRRAAFPRYFPSFDWLSRLGRIYAFEQHQDATQGLTRVCFDDMRRLDLVVTTSAAFASSEAMECLPLADGARVLFSRAPSLDAVLDREHPRKPPHALDDRFAALENSFWFKATVAVQKAVRGDLLVALHLSLELSRDCLVLAMMLRDRELGTTIHRDGAGNDLLGELVPAHLPDSFTSILDGIAESARSRSPRSTVGARLSGPARTAARLDRGCSPVDLPPGLEGRGDRPRHHDTAVASTLATSSAGRVADATSAPGRYR